MSGEDFSEDGGMGDGREENLTTKFTHDQMVTIRELLATATATATANTTAAAIEAASLAAQAAATYTATPSPDPTSTAQAQHAFAHEQAQAHQEDRATHDNERTDGTSSAGQDTVVQQLITALGRIGTTPNQGSTVST
ncbi:unnamed protein product [Pylaiella littoralis]